MSDTVQHFSEVYAYQKEVVGHPVIQAWLAQVNVAIEAMKGVDLEFWTSLQSEDEYTKVYHEHSGQGVVEMVSPMLMSVEGDDCGDEECLPYLRVKFGDGVTLLADSNELFSLDIRLGEVLKVVGGAFKVARELGYVGPWDLVAHGTDADRVKFQQVMGV